jgi:hypothetical protein
MASSTISESAADMLFALIASDVIEALIVDRRWSRKRLAEHLAILFRAAFVASDEPRPQAGGTEHRRGSNRIG